MSKQSQYRQKPKQNSAKAFNWLRLLKKTGITFAVVGVIFLSFYSYSQKLKNEHDLSVVGNGVPTVVQIHDPNCQLCNQLKANLKQVKSDYKGEIQFKSANINTQKGRVFANKHRVARVTLLFFDSRGNQVNVIQGVTPTEDIRLALNALASRL